jgi:hypothetical protein
MAVIKYKNPKYTEGGSEPKYIVIPTLTMENDEVYVGTTEPTEGEKIWVNPSNGLTKYKNGESWEDLVPEVDLSNYLAKDNSTEYIPSGEYNPSTKGYVDDKWFDISALLKEGEKYSEPTDITEFVNTTYGSIENLRENILLHKQLYRSHIGNNVEVIAAYPNLYHIVGKYGISDKHYKYIHFDLQANDDNTSITIYKIGELYEIVDGDGTKALMDNGQYVSTVLESNKNILRRVNIGTLTLTVGTNDSVNITNSNILNGINPFEWFIITCNLNGSDTYLYSYNDSEGIKCFRHYTNQDNNRSVAFIITNINTVNSTCSIEYNDNNLVTNKNISNYTLTKTNTTEYTPTADYHPTTKKYTDNIVNTKFADRNILNRIELNISSSMKDLNTGINTGIITTNTGKLSAVKSGEFFIVGISFTDSSFYVYAYRDGSTIKGFRHCTETVNLKDFVEVIISNINTENGTIDIDFRNVEYATKKETSDTESGLMSPSYKKTLDTITGINTVTTLANLPITKRSIAATVTAATSLSLASNLEVGQELYIRIYNNSSRAITQPIPNSGNFVSMNGTSVSIPSKSFIEMSIWCYKSSKYSIRIGEIA